MSRTLHFCYIEHLVKYDSSTRGEQIFTQNDSRARKLENDHRLGFAISTPILFSVEGVVGDGRVRPATALCRK